MELPSASPAISPCSSLTSEPNPPLPTLPAIARRLRAAPPTHTVAEAGASVFLRPPALLLARLFSTFLLVFAFVLFSAMGAMPPATLGAWAFYLATAALTLATLASLRYLLAPDRAAATATPGLSAALARLAVPFVQAALTIEITVAALYWIVVRLDNGPARPEEIAQHVVAPVLLLADAALAFRMAFRLSYVLLAPLVGVCWLAFAWIRFAATRKWPYAAMYFRSEGVGRTIAMHIGVVVGSAVVGVFVFTANRLNRHPVVKARIEKRVADDEVLSLSSANTDVVPEDGLKQIVFGDDACNLSTSFVAPLQVYVPAEI